MPSAAQCTDAQARADALAEWFCANSVALHGARIGLSAYGGVGVFATEVLKEGTVLFRVPRTLVLRVRRGVLGDALHAACVGGWAALALAVCAEAVPRASQSLWAGYLRFLPEEGRGHSQLNLPVLWDDEEMKLLRGTGMCARANTAEVAAYYERIVIPIVARLPQIFPDGLSLPQFTQAGALVSAYSFTVGKNGAVAMVPAADALNADGPAKSNAHLELLDDGSFEMVVTEPVAAGEELLNTYGALAESETLLRYGYIGTAEDVGDSAITIREMYAALNDHVSGIEKARLTLVVKRLRKAGVVVRAAAREAAPFMDTGDILPLSTVPEACAELERSGLRPSEVIGKVLFQRIRAIKQSDKADPDGETHRAKLARSLRNTDLPRLQEALRYISERNIT